MNTKKILLSLLATSCILSANYLNDKEIEKFDSNNFFQKIGTKITSVFDTGTIFVVEVSNGKGKDTIYVTKDKNTLLSGYAVDLRTGAKIDAPVKNLPIVKNKEVYSYGKGKDEYYMFTDTECPYCKDVLDALPQLQDKVKINILYYPLDSHVNAKELSKYQMSLKNSGMQVIDILKIDATNEGFKNRKIDATQNFEFDNKLYEQKRIAEEFGINGTPFIVDMQGNKLHGAEFLNKYNINVAPIIK